MQEVKLFEFESSDVRTLIRSEDDVWFCLKDVCDILELGNVSQVRTRLKEDGVISNEVIDALGRTQQAIFINEKNLYRVIFQSRKPQATRFQDWVFDDVLPSIRKYIAYSPNLLCCT